jgi:adenine deaminase
MVTPSPASQALFISREEARALLKDESVMGLGESYWQDVILPPDDRVLGLIQETLIAGKSVQGHTAGAADKRLAAYAAAGAESCHEAVSEENVLSRLELGYYVMIREGHIRRDIEIILPLKDKIDLRRTILVTDGTDPETLAQRGYLTDVVQKAVDLGLDPVKAVQMSSLNPAEHFGLDHMTGGIAPARFADILILPDLKTMQPDMVISKGQVVAENGKCLVPLTKVPYPDSLMHTVKIKPIARADLAVPVSAGGSRKNVRTIDIHPGGLVTREGSAEPKIIGGTYCADPDNDLLKIVFIESVSGRGEKFVGFVRGWGQRRGAVATSFCWDSSGIIALGANDHDLAAAISRVIALQGGLVLADGGKLLVDHALSIGGYISDMTIEDMAASHRQFQSIVRDLGSELESAFLTLQTLTTAAIPFIRMSEKGYCRFRERDIVGL